ncbi:MAG: DMT family transporter [Calditrichaeota bacterium]|nr:MAG: DMT family transporter [Calditrichota bacterium]
MRYSSLFLLIPVIFWGLSYIAIKIVLSELDPVEMISIRFLLGAPTLYLVLKFKKIHLFPVQQFWKLIIGGLLIYIHFWVMAVGMIETTASNTAWILTTAPIFIAILGWMFLSETFKIIQWVGLLIAAIGVLFLTANGSLDNLAWIKSRGDIIVLGSCVTWAIYTIWVRKITAHTHPLTATFWMTTIAGLIFIPYTFLTTDAVKFTSLQNSTIISLIFLGVFCLAIAFWLWSEGLKRLKAAEVGIYLYIEPLITMIGAWIILSESITVWLIIGAILISIGVVVAEKYGKVKVAEHDV